jgi:hypothetical protein
MRRFLLKLSGTYVVLVAACLVYTICDNGGFFSTPALLGTVLAEPWIMVIASFMGDQMSSPYKINSAIDDDQMSKVGMAAVALSGVINAGIIYGFSRFFKKSN